MSIESSTTSSAVGPFPVHLIDQLGQCAQAQSEILNRIRKLKREDPATIVARMTADLQEAFLAEITHSHQVTEAMVDWVLSSNAALQHGRVAEQAAEFEPQQGVDDGNEEIEAARQSDIGAIDGAPDDYPYGTGFPYTPGTP